MRWRLLWGAPLLVRHRCHAPEGPGRTPRSVGGTGCRPAAGSPASCGAAAARLGWGQATTCSRAHLAVGPQQVSEACTLLRGEVFLGEGCDQPVGGGAGS